MLRLVLTYSLVLACVISHGQEEEKVWTLKELVDYAIANNLTVKRGTYNVETGEIDALQSKMTLLPTLNSSGNFGYNWGRTVDPTTNLFTQQRVNAINLNATSSLLLWNGFSLFYDVKQNETELEAINEDLIKARNDVILNVITLYLNVVFNKELLSNSQYQLRSTVEQLERTKKLADAGSVPKGNVLNLEAQQATNELNVIQRENALNLSLLQLKQALQIPFSTSLDVELPQIDVENELVIGKSVVEIFEISMITMPEIKAAQLRRKSAAFALKSTKGSLYPSLSFNASLTTLFSDQQRDFLYDGTSSEVPIGYIQGTPSNVVVTQVVGGSFVVPSRSTQFENNLGTSIGINLQIPIFNGLSARSAVKRAAISRDLADISLTETENQLRQSVETAYNDAVAASKTYNSSLKQVNARDEAFRMTKQRFDIGAVNYVEYQVAENDLFQAQSDLLRAKYDFIFRKQVLDFYQGLPLGF